MSTSDVVSQIQAAVADANPNGLKMIQGVVTAVDYTTSPPTLSATISGSTAVTSNLRFLQSYTPQVGDVVQILSQNSSLLVVDTIYTDPLNTNTPYGIAKDWTAPTLASGITTPAGGGGNVYYRIIHDHGTDRIDFKGSVGIPGLASNNQLLFNISGTAIAVFRLGASISSSGAAEIGVDTSGAVTLRAASGANVAFLDGVSLYAQ